MDSERNLRELVGDVVDAVDDLLEHERRQFTQSTVDGRRIWAGSVNGQCGFYNQAMAVTWSDDSLGLFDQWRQHHCEKLEDVMGAAALHHWLKHPSRAPDVEIGVDRNGPFKWRMLGAFMLGVYRFSEKHGTESELLTEVHRKMQAKRAKIKAKKEKGGRWWRRTS